MCCSHITAWRKYWAGTIYVGVEVPTFTDVDQNSELYSYNQGLWVATWTKTDIFIAMPIDVDERSRMSWYTGDLGFIGIYLVALLFLLHIQNHLSKVCDSVSEPVIEVENLGNIHRESLLGRDSRPVSFGNNWLFVANKASTTTSHLTRCPNWFIDSTALGMFKIKRCIVNA